MLKTTALAAALLLSVSGLAMAQSSTSTTKNNATGSSTTTTNNPGSGSSMTTTTNPQNGTTTATTKCDNGKIPSSGADRSAASGGAMAKNGCK